MSALEVTLGPTRSVYTVDGDRAEVPVGVATLGAMLTSDPPAPEELVNAIGWLSDHLEDVTRELPSAELVDHVHVAGPGIAALAAVEVGHEVPLPFLLERDAAEDVFRTLVTESAAVRALNPGLPAGEVQSVLGTACVVVALMRFLQRADVHLVADEAAG